MGSQSTVSTPADGVLANDSDPEGDALRAVREEDVEHGLLSLDADGTFTYTPDDNYFGTDSFSYRVGDGALESDPVVVTIRGPSGAPTEGGAGAAPSAGATCCEALD